MSGLAEVVAQGDMRESLEALRDRLAGEVERVADEGFCVSCKRGSSSIAPLAKQLADVLKLIDALPVAEGGSKLDDLTARRAKRLAASTG